MVWKLWHGKEKWRGTCGHDWEGYRVHVTHLLRRTYRQGGKVKGQDVRHGGLAQGVRAAEQNVVRRLHPHAGRAVLTVTVRCSTRRLSDSQMLDCPAFLTPSQAVCDASTALEGSEESTQEMPLTTCPTETGLELELAQRSVI